MVKYSEETLLHLARHNYERTYKEIEIAYDLEEIFKKEINECENFINESFTADDLLIYSMEKGIIDAVFKRLHDYKKISHGRLICDIQNISCFYPGEDLYIHQIHDLRIMAESLSNSLASIDLHIDCLAEYCKILFPEDYKNNEYVFEKEPGEYYSHDYLEWIISIGEILPTLQPEP